MSAQFAEQLHAELAVIQAELERLEARRRLVEELLELESNAAASPTSAPARTAAPRRSGTAKRRLPRVLISRTVREFLGRQAEPAHATAILAELERRNAAPQGAKPIANLQSNLQRMQEASEIENVGRNRWRLRQAAGRAVPAARPAPSRTPPVVRSTTFLGSRPSARG
ncbi:MAG: hypothetical protein F4209_08350 [Chloroflexi bacterium]|nr:hypothetical protein [Chloroflexota bacterium]MYF22747.1 hypothetical protein [Chloroflexota bacterium]